MDKLVTQLLDPRSPWRIQVESLQKEDWAKVQTSLAAASLLVEVIPRRRGYESLDEALEHLPWKPNYELCCCHDFDLSYVDLGNRAGFCLFLEDASGWSNQVDNYDDFLESFEKGARDWQARGVPCKLVEVAPFYVIPNL